MTFQNFPYTDFQNLNLDWILRTIAKMNKDFVPKILESVNEWLNEHPEATTTVQDGSITAQKLQPDFLDEIAMKDDLETINKEYFPDVTKIGTVAHDANQIQGMATDGEYLYLCGDNSPNEISVFVVHPSTLSFTKHVITGIYGHANDCAYFNGFLYITGCNNTAGTTVYTKLAKVNTRTWESSLIDLPTDNEWWGVEIGTAYNGKHVLLGHRAYTALIDAYATIYAGSASQAGLDKWLPWETINIEPFACDPAGLTQYNKWLMIGDAHLSNQLARNAIRVFTTDGGFKCNIYLKEMGNKELEDVCCIGDVAYVVDIEGTVYTFPLDPIFGHNYDMGAFSTTASNYGVKYAYISDNGSEVYSDLGGGNTFCTAFRTNPFYFRSTSKMIDATLVLPKCMIKGVFTESTGLIRFNGMYAFSNNSFVSYTFVYTPSVPADGDEYLYTLTEAKAVAYYNDEINYYDTLQDIADAGYIGGNAYIRNITYESAPKYTYTPLNLQ